MSDWISDVCSADLTNAEGIASVIAIPLDMLARAAKPVVSTLGAINRLVLRLLGIRDDARNAITEEEIRLLVSESHEQGLIDADERNMMQRVMRLGDRTADSLMTPRPRITWLDAAASFEENLAAMQETPYSRYPVYRGSDADVLGVLEVKSLLEHLDQRTPDLFRELRETVRSEEHTSELQSLMRISYAVFCLKKKTKTTNKNTKTPTVKHKQH